MMTAPAAQTNGLLPLRVRHLGSRDYAEVWHDMQTFTARRDAGTVDELWLLQHPPVYTLGLAGKREHLLNPGAIPVLAVDRGGQVTYHGPGQIVAYVLLDLRRRRLGVRELVARLEQAVIQVLADYGVSAQADEQARGVYVDGRKIAALGLRVRRGCSYHGLSLNVAMDLAPFHGINPCGYEGMEVTQLQDLAPSATIEAVDAALVQRLAHQLGYAIQAGTDG